MPYILKTDREKFEVFIRSFLLCIEEGKSDKAYEVLAKDLRKELTCAGDLNYVLSSVLWRYFDKKASYSRANLITDVLNRAYDGLFGADREDSVLDITFEEASALEYAVFSICHNARQKISTVRGVLRDVEAEFRRRRVDAYEDSKISDPKNGDI